MPDTAPSQGGGDRPLFENDDGGRGLGPTLGGDLGEAPLPPAPRSPKPEAPADQQTGPVPGDVMAPDGVAPAYGVGPAPGFDGPDRGPIDGDLRAPAARPGPGPQATNEQEGELRDQARAQSSDRAPDRPDARQVETDGADPLPDDNNAL